jgi:hypothetical protein
VRAPPLINHWIETECADHHDNAEEDRNQPDPERACLSHEKFPIALRQMLFFNLRFATHNS